MTVNTPPVPTRLFIPALEPFYRRFAIPAGWLLFRLTIGGMLVVEGWPKILAPMSQAGFVESLGFHPGWFYSPLLAVMQFFGGLMIMAGVFTRPVAVANGVMLLVTVYYHFSHPFGPNFFTPAGFDVLKTHVEYLTPQGQFRLLRDGGVGFIELVQTKAEEDSLFWAAGAFLIAAFGGWHWSMDRDVLKREI